MAGECYMRMTIIKKKTGHALGVLLCIIGIIMLLITVWKLWAEEVFTSSDMLSALKASLWTEYTDLTLGIGLKPIHYTVFGILLLVIGSAILIARREKVTVTEEATVMLECPYCKHQWRESMSKTHLKSMGYPRVRTLSRRKCPKCAKFIRPKIAQTNV
jgi:hypothetical protein